MYREIYITADISKETATDIVAQIKAMSEGIGANQPIKMYVNCFGGSATAMFTILDAMATCPCEIITVNLGEADSAAALIFSAGSKRFITENSRVMIHEVRLSTLYSAEPLSQIEAELKEFQILNDNMFKALAKNTGKKPEEIKADVFGKDLYLSAEEAIEYGLADAILTTEIKEKYSLKKVDLETVRGSKTTKEKRMITKEEAIKALKNDFDMDVVAIKADNEAKTAELTSLKAEKEQLTASNTELTTKVETLEAEKVAEAAKVVNAKKEAAFDKAAGEGRIPLAVKEETLKAFKGLEDLEGYLAKLPVVLSNKAKGSSEPGAVVELTETEKATAKKMGVSEEDFKKTKAAQQTK